MGAPGGPAAAPTRAAPTEAPAATGLACATRCRTMTGYVEASLHWQSLLLSVSSRCRRVLHNKVAPPPPPPSLLDFGFCSATCCPIRAQHSPRIRLGLPALRHSHGSPLPPLPPQQAILHFVCRIYGAVQENGCIPRPFWLPISSSGAIRSHGSGYPLFILFGWQLSRIVLNVQSTCYRQAQV